MLLSPGKILLRSQLPEAQNFAIQDRKNPQLRNFLPSIYPNHKSNLARLSLFSAAVALFFNHGTASAQIVPDDTLPQNSEVSRQGNLMEITGGTVRGTNLFHSFEQFSFGGGNLNQAIDTAYFNNGNDIVRIFSRVTGNSISEINGLLQTNGSADLFLLNPNGIVFGNKASLDIGGSFIGSTASSIVFEDSAFDALNPQRNALLSINIPLGLQYGVQPQGIAILGKENNSGGLTVLEDKTLGLVGGDLIFAGGTVSAPGGNIVFGSVAEPGIVDLTPNGSGWKLDYGEIARFGKIALSETAVIEGANIEVNSKSLSLQENAQIYLKTYPERKGIVPRGALNIEAKFIFLQNSGLFSLVEEQETRDGGDINLQSDSLILSQEAQITSKTLGAGNGGDIKLSAAKISLSDRSQIDSRAIIGRGDGGDIAIATESLTLATGAKIYSGNFANAIAEHSNSSRETGGDRVLTTLQITPTSLDYQIIGTGEVGAIEIQAQEILLDSREQTSSIATSSYANGGGDITIDTNNIFLLNNSKITTDTQGNSDGGAIDLTAENLYLRNGGEISTTTLGSGNGGQIALEIADDLLLVGEESKIESRANLAATGNPGKIIGFGKKERQLGNISVTRIQAQELSSVLHDSNSVDLGLNFTNYAIKLEAFSTIVTSNRNDYLAISSGCLPTPRFASFERSPEAQIAVQNLDSTDPFQLYNQQPTIEAQSWKIDSMGNVELVAGTCR